MKKKFADFMLDFILVPYAILLTLLIYSLMWYHWKRYGVILE